MVALFVALGGASYAAIAIPHNSIGPAQLRNGAVTYTKIVPGAVGTVRANTRQLQARVSAKCNIGSAIGAIDQAGKITCNPSLPNEYATSNTQTVSPSPTTVATLNLPAGTSYLSIANPSADVSASAAETVQLQCTLTDGANTQTRNVSVDTEAGGRRQARDDPADGRRPGRQLERRMRAAQPYRHGRADGQRDRGDQRDPDRQQQLARRGSQRRRLRSGSRVGGARPG